MHVVVGILQKMIQGLASSALESRSPNTCASFCLDCQSHQKRQDPLQASVEEVRVGLTHSPTPVPAAFLPILQRLHLDTKI